MLGLGKILEQICDLVIRPQRFNYHPSVLGPRLFMIGSNIFERKDCEIKNSRDMVLKCSHFVPHERQRLAEKLPCVIYLHGNCGSRCDALACLNMLLQNQITVFAFDFSGSGLSDGDFVSLGYYEKDDVKVVIQHLRKEGRTSRIALWGRSMGAATAILCSAMDDLKDDIYGVVADSSFMSLQDLIIILVKKYIKGTPKTMIRFGIKQMRRNILNRAKFDIDKLVPIEYARRSTIPIYIAHAWGDKFMTISHSEKIFEEYGGQKCIMRFEGDHNSERPDAMCFFLVNRLICQDPTAEKLRVKIFQKKRRGMPGPRSIGMGNSNTDSSSDDSDGDGSGIDFMDSDEDGENKNEKKKSKGQLEVEEVEGEEDEDGEDIIIHGSPEKKTKSRRKIARRKKRRIKGTGKEKGEGKGDLNVSSPSKSVGTSVGSSSSSSYEINLHQYPPSPSSVPRKQIELPTEIKEEEAMKKVLIDSAEAQMNQTEDEGDKEELMNKIIVLKLELEKIKQQKLKYLTSTQQNRKKKRRRKKKEVKEKKKKKSSGGEEEEEEEEAMN